MLCLPILSSGVAASARAASLADCVAAVSSARIGATIAALEGERATLPQRQAAADAIEAALESYGFLVAREAFATGTNVVAWLPGTQPSARVVVVGAHYDTVPGSPGAGDDASGIAALLEIARVLRAEPRRDTIGFVAFDRGETLREGSFAHAYTLISGHREITGMISLDGVGFRCDTPGCQTPLVDVGQGCFTTSAAGVDVGDFLAIVANDASAAQQDAFVAAAAQYVPSLRVETGRVAGKGFCSEPTRASDHASFWDFELTGLLATDTAALRNPHHHQAGDVAATLDVGFTTDVARATLAWAAILAPEPGSSLAAASALAAVAALRRLRVTPRGRRSR